MSTETTTVTIGEATTVTVSANTGPRGATGDQTAAEILTAIKTVDGSGSGLDADTVDGVEAAALAPLASPTFTGIPAAPTATAGTNSTQIATTAYVDNATSSALEEADIGVTVQGYDANNVSGDGTVLDVVKLTQAAYDALTPVATTLYVIEG